MKIAISKDYFEFAEELSLKGYEVSLECNKCENYDVIICNLKNEDLDKYNFCLWSKNEGTLIIDKGSKSVGDVEKIIKGRIL